MSVLRLVPVIGDDVVLDQDRALVGREPTCDVIVEHGSVSRKHALLERRPEGWFVVDQASANGTFIDSVKVGESALRNGQELRFGAAAYRVDLPPDEDEAGATIITTAPDATVLTPLPPGLRAGAVPPRPSVPSPSPATAPPRPATPPRVGPPAMPPPLPPRVAPPPLPPRAAVAPPGVPGPPPVPQMTDAPPPPRKGKGPVFWIATGCGGCLLMVLLFAGLIAGGAWYMASGAADAVRAQLGDLKAGRVDDAYGRLSEGYRSSVSRPGFAAFVDRHPSLKDNADATFMSRNVTNDRAQLNGTLKAGSGVSESAAYRLVKEGGDWKIEFMEVEGDRPEAGGVAQAAAAAPAGGNLSLRADVGKTRQPDQVRVLIRAEAAGFAVRPDAGQFAYDLAEDVETMGPDGQPVQELTRADVQRHQGRTSLAQGAVYPFERVLTLDPALAPGTYVVRLTIRDLVGGGRSSREVRFDMP